MKKENAELLDDPGWNIRLAREEKPLGAMVSLCTRCDWVSRQVMELDGALDEYRKHKQRVHPRCEECFGHGHYWTEWSDSADRDPAMVKLVIMRPIMPDGTVLIRCQHCNGSGVVVTDAYVNHEHHPA